jgi:hypothetical protein
MTGCRPAGVNVSPIWISGKKALLRCKKLLALHPPAGYIVHRSNTVTDRAVCFLGRFLPKLGGASAPPFFCQRRRAVSREVNPPMPAYFIPSEKPGRINRG